MRHPTVAQRFLVLSLGRRPSFHAAVRRALGDLTADSDRTLRIHGLDGGAPPPGPAAVTPLPVHRELLAKARAHLDGCAPAPEIVLVCASAPDSAADAVLAATRAAGRAGPATRDSLPLVLIDAVGSEVSSSPFSQSVPSVLEKLSATLPPHLEVDARDTVVYTGRALDPAHVARPYTLRRLRNDPALLVSDVACQFTDRVQQRLNTALRMASRSGSGGLALAAALHAFLRDRAGGAWGLHYFTGSVVSGLIAELDRLATADGAPVLRGPSEHSLACAALARWQLDAAPFLIVVTSGMVDEFRGTLANLRLAAARGFVVCADSPPDTWYPFQGTVHGAEDSRAVLRARGVPYVHLQDPATLADDLAEAFAAYERDEGPVFLLATPAVLEAPAKAVRLEHLAGGRHRRPVLQARESALEPVVRIVNSERSRLLWQCGSLDRTESGLVHDIARRAGAGLADSLTRPGTVAKYRDGTAVPEYLGSLGLYGFSSRVHDYLHDGGRLRPPDEQCVFFLKSRVGQVATPFSPRTLARGLRIVQVTREPAHLAPFTDFPVPSDARSFLTALRERLRVEPEVLELRRAAIAAAGESASDVVHALPTLPMSCNHFFHRLAAVLTELITTSGYTYTGIFDVGRGGASAVRNLPRTGPGFSGWYGRALMGDALQAVPAVALTRDDNVLAFVGDGAGALVPDILPTLVQQVCLDQRPFPHNLTVFRLIDGGLSAIRTYHEGRTGAELSRQMQVLHLLEPEWSKSYGPLTVHHRHLTDPAHADLAGWLREPSTVNLCSVLISHNNEGDGMSLLSSLGWQRDTPVRPGRAARREAVAS